MDTLKEMRTFVRIVEAGSLSAAARRLRVSLPSVSRKLAALERRLGVTLILRSTRRMTITEVGRRYHESCVRAIREIEAAEDAVRDQDKVQGRVVITAPVTFGVAHISPALPEFLAGHPALVAELRLEDHVVDLTSENVDIAVRGGLSPPDSSVVVAYPLATFRRLLVASPGYLRRRGAPKTVASLAAHDAILQLPGLGTPGVWRLSQGETTHTVEVRGPLVTNAVYAIKEAALGDLGLALLPEWLIAKELERGALCRVLPQFEAGIANVYALVRSEQRHVRRIRATIDHLRASCARRLDRFRARGP